MKREGAIAFGEIAVDFDRMELRRSGRLIPASVLEFRLLKFFVDNPEYVFGWLNEAEVKARTESERQILLIVLSGVVPGQSPRLIMRAPNNEYSQG